MSYLFWDIPYKYVGWNSKKEGHPGSRYRPQQGLRSLALSVPTLSWVILGRMEKKMETTIMGYMINGDNGKENANYYHRIYDIWG